MKQSDLRLSASLAPLPRGLALNNRHTQSIFPKVWHPLVAVLAFIWLSGCQPPSPPAVRNLNIQQSWELKPGDRVGDRLVTGSLGDVSIDLGGARLYAPFRGEVEPAAEEHCVIYSTAEVPAYLFRFCGLRRLQFGKVQAGETIGSGSYLQFATLRRQPDGTWIIVEPSTGILERAINPNLPQRPISATPNTEDLPDDLSSET